MDMRTHNGMRLTMGRVATAAFFVASLTLVLAQPPQPPAGGQGRAGGGRGPATPPLIMTSTACEDGGVIHDNYIQAAGAHAQSPEFNWSPVQPGKHMYL